ncbi:MAG: hypothetical protein DMD57_14770 [Gemmatimonadetes bacterium]|nr:MAG: hypothetical protein DMD57_14770 [Gemmatimonadota bacterium]
MASPAPVTVVIPTRNEGAQIAECVGRLAWAAEVIVVDGGSTDGTRELARAAGARVLDGAVVQGPTIAHQRNAGIGAATHEWVFALDADERVGPELSAELAATVAAPAREAYAVRRRNVFLGETVRHAGWGRDWVVRLFRKNRRFVAAHGRRPRVTDLIVRPPARFVRMYFLQLGILDGWRGAMLCGLAAASVLVKYARLWERSR